MALFNRGGQQPGGAGGLLGGGATPYRLMALMQAANQPRAIPTHARNAMQGGGNRLPPVMPTAQQPAVEGESSGDQMEQMMMLQQMLQQRQQPSAGRINPQEMEIFKQGMPPSAGGIPGIGPGGMQDLIGGMNFQGGQGLPPQFSPIAGLLSAFL